MMKLSTMIPSSVGIMRRKRRRIYEAIHNHVFTTETQRHGDLLRTGNLRPSVSLW
jgi:hypothetical protein